MAFYRCGLGGGAGIDLMNPDVTWARNAASTSDGNISITVTQKPKYIILSQWSRTGSGYTGQIGIVDVTNSTGKRQGYTGSGAVSWSSWSYSTCFPTISNSQVVFNTAAWGAASRNQVLIYY